MNVERVITLNVAPQTDEPACFQLAWRYLRSRELPLFGDHCAILRAASHMLLEAEVEKRVHGQLLGLSLGCMAAIGSALEVWIILSAGPVVADLAIRMASGVALIITGLDASAAREKWATARKLIKAIKNDHIEQALRLALERREAVAEDADVWPPWRPKL